MKISSQLNGGIYEVSFGYNPNLDGYTTLMSDIPKLGDILLWAILKIKENKTHKVGEVKTYDRSKAMYTKGV